MSTAINDAKGAMLQHRTTYQEAVLDELGVRTGFLQVYSHEIHDLSPSHVT